MLSWFLGVVGAFVLSIVSAYSFLRHQCRGLGPPLGPRARPWAVTIIMITAIVSTGLGVALAAVTHRIEAAYISFVIPSSLLLSKLPPQRDLDLLPRRKLSLTLPFSRLYDRIGEDMQDWCDIRVRAASPNPQWEADAVNYYYSEVQRRLKDTQARADLERRRESITHKISIGLEADALNEMAVFLWYIYRLGYSRRLVIYPFRPSAHR